MILAEGMTGDRSQDVADPDALRDPAGVIKLPRPSPDFAETGWCPIGASIDTQSSVPGPNGAPLRWISSNRNAFARLESAERFCIDPTELVVFSVLIVRPTALISGFALDSPDGKPELRVRWVNCPPQQRLVGLGTRPR